MNNKKNILFFVVRVFVFQFVIFRVSGKKSCCHLTEPTKTMPKSWECGVCVMRWYYFHERCLRVFKYTMDSDTCLMAEDKCSDPNRILECPTNNFVSCQNLFSTEFRCVCKQDFIGNSCQTQKPKDFVGFPEGWAMFLQHTISYASLRKLSIVVVAYKETPYKNRPITVHISDSQGGNVILSKRSMIVTLDDNLFVWCRVSTTLEEYCARLSLIMDKNQYKDQNIVSKSLFIVNAPFPAMQRWDPRPDFITWNPQLYRYRTKEIGYLGIIKTRVYTGLLKAPFLSITDGGNLILYDRRAETFFNYTGLDEDCIPNLVLRPASATATSARKIFTNERIHLRASVLRPSSNCKKGNLKEWRIWKLRYNANMNEGIDVLRYGTDEFFLPEYTFRESAAYYITYHAENFLSSGAKFNNYKGAWFEVMHHPLIVNVPFVDIFVNAESLNRIRVDAKDENVKPSEEKKGLEYHWSCHVNTTGSCAKVERYFHRSSPIVVFPPHSLVVDTVYTITVTVRKVTVPQLTPVTRYIYVTVGTNEADLITLVCSCEDYTMLPDDVNFVYVKSIDGEGLPKKEYDYVWEYAAASKKDLEKHNYQWKSANDIRIYGTSVFTFKIRPNSLEYGKTYLFKATVPNTRVMGSLMITTPDPPYKLNCLFLPEEGSRGLTDFDFNCTIDREAGSLVYEFYDKEKDDEFLFSGRMLGSSTDGSLPSCKLTEGVVSIYAFNYFRVIARYTLPKIPLVPFNGTNADLERYIDQAKSLVADKQYDFASGLASSVSAVLEKKMNPKPQLLGSPIRIMEQITSNLPYNYSYLPTVKMILSSLTTILKTTTSQFDVYEENADLTKSASDALLVVTDHIMKVENNMKAERVTYRLLLEIFETIIDCAELILMQKNREAMSKPEEYVRPFVGDMIHQTSYTIIRILEMVVHFLGRTQGPGDSQTEVVSAMGNITACVMVTWIRELDTWSARNSSTIDISKKLANSAGNPTDVGVILYVKSIIDPFWWAGGQVVTEVLILDFCKRKELMKCVALTKFKHRLVVHLQVVKPLDFIIPISGQVRRLDPDKMSEEELDLAMTVYRFFLPERAKMFLKFLIDGSEEYRVLFVEGRRPDYAMVKNATLVNAKSPEYPLEYDSEGEGHQKIYYMGILPAGNASTKESIPFRLKAYYAICFTWIKWYYAAYGCWVGNRTNETSVQCDCSHLSLVSSTLAVPEYNFHPAWDFPLLLTPWENFMPLLLLILMLFSYLVLVNWAIFNDKKDRKQGDVIILDDNFPGERYAYLVAVYTGSKLNSGTSALVGIKLYGKHDDSRPHILTSSKRKVMQAFSDDWFLMYCPKHLGKIRRMLLWHNSQGFSPDWFIEKIEIYDLHRELQYTFEINDWMEIEKDTNADAYVAPLKVYQFFSISKVFYQNFATGLKDTHYWTSICFKHPRNPVPRIARVSVVACLIMVVFALCLVLYLLHFGIDIEEDKPSYYLLTTVDLLIFIAAYLPACLVANVAMAMYRKAYTHEYQTYVTPDIAKKSIMGEKNNLSLSEYIEQDELFAFNEADLKKFRNVEVVHTKDGIYRYQVRENRHKARNVWENIIMVIHKIARGSLLLPVKLPTYKTELIVNRGWCVAAWLFCGVIMCINIVIILYLAWRLPTVKTEKYLTTFFAVILVDALLISFLKIFFFSAILSLMFQRILPAASYNVRSEDGRRMNFFGDIPFLGNLLTTRARRIYIPLSSEDSDKKRVPAIRRHKLRLLVDFVMVVILALVISAILNIYVTERFPSNDHAKKMMAGSISEKRPSFLKLHNRTEYFEYLQVTYVNRLYTFIWYTYEPLSEPEERRRKDWTDDCVTRLVGNTRLRQLRVREGECATSGYLRNLTIDCAPAWSLSSEDTVSYTPGWANKSKGALENSPWSYVSSQDSNSSEYYGQSLTPYHGGGYIAQLGFYKRQTRMMLQTLEKEGWLGHRTRAVVVELTLYNVNLDYFTQVVLVTEQQPSGEYVTVSEVDSITRAVKFNFWNISFVIFQVFFLFRMVYFMEKLGIITYLSNILYLFEVFLLVLGFGTVILYIIHIKSSTDYIEKHVKVGYDEFFSFFNIIRYAYMSARVMYFLFFCIIVKLLCSWRFGVLFFAFYYTVKLSRAWIVWLTFFYMICLAITWRLVGYMLNVFMYSHLNAIIIYKKDQGELASQELFMVRIVVYMMCFMSACVITLFIASFTHFYRISRRCYIPSHLYPDLNFALFVKEEIVNFIRGRKRFKKKI